MDYATSVEVLGDRHPNTLTSLNNLAGIYQAIGQWDRATDLRRSINDPG